MIYYFTATGNSKYVAEKIAEKTNDKLVNITECVQNKDFSFTLNDGENVGFVTPVYFFGIPMIVTEFLQKLKIKAKVPFYSYAVLNCGGSAGNAEQILLKAYPVDAVFGVITVDNYVPIYKIESDAKIEENLDNADSEIAKITEHIRNKDKGCFNNVRGKFAKAFTAIAYPIYKKGRKTKRFTVNDDCIGCGICENVCPRKAIELVDGKPVWKIPQCEHCLSCLHRCPKTAINFGKKSAGNGRYCNPRTQMR